MELLMLYLIVILVVLSVILFILANFLLIFGIFMDGLEMPVILRILIGFVLINLDIVLIILWFILGGMFG